jgi:hypothetical protein
VALRFAPELAGARASPWKLLLSFTLMLSATLPLVAGHAGGEELPPRAQHEWPLDFDGQPLQPLALSKVEQRFAEQFPGRIGRFSSEGRTITLRVADRPTRTGLPHPRHASRT